MAEPLRLSAETEKLLRSRGSAYGQVLVENEDLAALLATLDAARADVAAAEPRGEARGLELAAILVLRKYERLDGAYDIARDIRALKAAPP